MAQTGLGTVEEQWMGQETWTEQLEQLAWTLGQAIVAAAHVEQAWMGRELRRAAGRNLLRKLNQDDVQTLLHNWWWNELATMYMYHRRDWAEFTSHRMTFFLSFSFVELIQAFFVFLVSLKSCSIYELSSIQMKKKVCNEQKRKINNCLSRVRWVTWRSHRMKIDPKLQRRAHECGKCSVYMNILKDKEVEMWRKKYGQNKGKWFFCDNLKKKNVDKRLELRKLSRVSALMEIQLKSTATFNCFLRSYSRLLAKGKESKWN